MELILIIVVLVLLFGGGGGYWGRRRGIGEGARFAPVARRGGTKRNPLLNKSCNFPRDERPHRGSEQDSFPTFLSGVPTGVRIFDPTGSKAFN